MRFEIAPQKIAFFRFSKFGHLRLVVGVSQTKNIAIWILRFRNAAIAISFRDVSAEPAVRIAILNLRLENVAIAIAIFWDAKLLTS